MHKRILVLLGVAALMLTASLASALAKYPPGPLGTCTDTLSLYDVNNPASTCYPIPVNGAPGDTVLGVGGIITAVDSLPTGFGIYLENSAGGQWSGMDVFTHGTNYWPTYNMALGDSIVVEYAVTSGFQGGLELFSPNNLFSAPNIILRKVSAGNPVPAAHVGTTTELKETAPLSSNGFGGPWDGVLVRIDGPLTVARTSLQTNKTSPPLPFNSFLVVSAGAPLDSVCVEGSTLTNYTPPPVGTTVDYVQGIYDHRTRGWKIMLRGGNDIGAHTGPGYLDAYALADDKVRVTFDRNITTATGTDVNNYSLASLGSVDAAVMDGTQAVILTITNGLAHGVTESVTAQNIVGLDQGFTGPTDTKSFVNGVLSCLEMTTPNPDSLAAAVCLDKPRYAGGGGQINQGAFGPRSTITGICTAQYGNLFYFQDAGAPGRSGQTIFAPAGVPAIGHKYLLAGVEQAFFGENEFTSIQYSQDLGFVANESATDVSVGTVASNVCDATATLLNPMGSVTSGRDYLSMLVKLKYCKVVQARPTLPTFGFHVVGPPGVWSDTILVENQNIVLGPNSTATVPNPNYPAVGSFVDVVGCVHYSPPSAAAITAFRVCPRNGADITNPSALLSVGNGSPAKLSFSVYPNPGRTANISFALPHKANVKLGVYDLAGRQVREILNGSMAAGEYSSLKWDGRDASGKLAGPGMYFYRLNAGGEVRTVRAILLNN